METVNKRAEFEAYEEYNPKGFANFLFVIIIIFCMAVAFGTAYGVARLLTWLIQNGN